jgi:hypothetical protein
MSLIHISIARGHYIGQVRKEGHRRWQSVTTRRRATPEAALKDVARNMDGMKRGRVLFIDDSGWYEPNLVMEVNRA